MGNYGEDKWDSQFQLILIYAGSYYLKDSLLLQYSFNIFFVSVCEEVYLDRLSCL